jgi:AcrR family transcriptional regulator
LIEVNIQMSLSPSQAFQASPRESAASPTAGPGLRVRNKRAKLARIRAAAGALFREKGFDATTGREIAERAGVATGTVFLYVRDKRELLFLIFREDAERILDAAPRTLAEGVSLVDALMELFGPLLEFYGREPAMARLFVRELFFRPNEEQEEMGALSRRLGEVVLSLVVAARARDELRADVEPRFATGMLLAQYGFWILGWLGVGTVPEAAVAPNLQRALALTIAGLAP